MSQNLTSPQSQPLVSIIIPAYNCAPYIEASIESALNQTYPYCEVIVCDDGSQDETLAIAKRYEDRGVQVYTQTNRGASAARNLGLSYAKGELIQFLDGDDLLAPDKLARQIPRYQQDCLLSGQWAPFYFSPKGASFSAGALAKDLDPTTWLITSWNHEMMQPGCWLTPRALIDKAGLWNEELFRDNDGEYFSRVILAAKKVLYCDGAKVYYRVGNQGNLSWGRSLRSLTSLFEATNLETSRLLAKDSSLAAKEACAKRWVSFIYEAYPDVTHLREKAQKELRALKLPPPAPPGGLLFQMLSRLVGWQKAKGLRAPYYSLKVASIKAWFKTLFYLGLPSR